MRFAFLLLCTSAYGQVWPSPGPGKASLATGCTPVSGYSHCRVILISASQAGTVDTANYPLSVVTTLGGSRIQDAQCDDVVFTSDSAGTTLIPWEIESCTQATGAIVAWVQMSNLSVSVNGAVYVSYQNASVTTAQNTGALLPSVIWGAGPTYHLGGTTLNPNDSSTSGANLSGVAGIVTATGLIDGAAGYNGTTQYLFRNSTPITGPPVTFTAWIFPTAVVAASNVMGIAASGNNDNWLAIGINASVLYIDDNASGGAGYLAVSGATTLTTSTWYYVAVVFASGTMTVYLNGVSDGSGPFNSPAGVNTMSVGGLLRGGSLTQPFAGKIDEARMTTAVLTPSRLLADFNSQKPGQTMVTVGSEI